MISANILCGGASGSRKRTFLFEQIGSNEGMEVPDGTSMSVKDGQGPCPQMSPFKRIVQDEKQMRPQQQKNRMRGRGRKQPNPLSRNYESNGPDVKIRGNASHIAEKYSQLARDAQSSGDRVMAENYLQHAEHYFRIIAASQPVQRGDDQPGAGFHRNGHSDYDGDDEDGYGESGADDRSQRSLDGREENRASDRQARSDRDGQRNGGHSNGNQGNERQGNERQGGDNRRSQGASGRNRDEDNRAQSRGNGERRDEHSAELFDPEGSEQPEVTATASDEGQPERNARGRDNSRGRRRPRNGESDGGEVGNGDGEGEAAPRTSRTRRPARREGASADASALPESLFAPMPPVQSAISGEAAKDE